MDTTVTKETRTVGDLAVGNGLRGHTLAGSSIVGRGVTANTFFTKATGGNRKSTVWDRTNTPVPHRLVRSRLNPASNSPAIRAPLQTAVAKKKSPCLFVNRHL